MGYFEFSAKNMTFLFDTYVDYFEGVLEVDFDDIRFDTENINMTFTGVSDLSDYWSWFSTYATNVAARRLSSMSRYDPAIRKLNSLMKIILGLIPDENDVPGTDLYI